MNDIFKKKPELVINKIALAMASYAYAEATGEDVPADAMLKALQAYETARDSK